VAVGVQVLVGVANPCAGCHIREELGSKVLRHFQPPTATWVAEFVFVSLAPVPVDRIDSVLDLALSSGRVRSSSTG